MTLQPIHSKRAIAVVVLSSLLGSVALPAAPQQPKPQEGATITPNYKDADLSQIIQASAR